MLPSTTGVIGIYLCDLINLTTSIYSVINVKVFLEDQRSKRKPIHLLAIKNLSSFLHIVIIFCAIFVLYKCNHKSLV